MIPHERSLVQRLADKPFALLGVNSDSRAKYLAAVKEGGITWRSWLDGGGTNGPIAARWNIDMWPTVYVLDAKGVIRYKDTNFSTLHGEALDQAVDALIQEATNAAAGE